MTAGPHSAIAAVVLVLALGGCREPNASQAGQAPAAAAAATSALAAGPAPTLKLNPSQLCNLEVLDGALFGPADAEVSAPFRLRGWLGDASGAAPETPVFVLATEDGRQVTLPVVVATERPDVVGAFGGKASLLHSGFEVDVDPTRLPPGRWHAYLRYSVGSRNFVCDNGRHLRIAAR